ncbi:alpha/beta fold hydrolase [Streptomyces sp. SID8361]|uniref:alpha/beta fold hydrolase n=1 Tax=Streptomyces sp. MnatMP-M27 TaxID=1839768 RepID=UPI00081F0011|nr:alpha/beta hydrolase [Streptomyces sp. MnatMP-M27]MYU11183.1 alpha/beta fold hydrolase [Streptomyces sp. SID8361]SCF78968.1 Pimeloyl-ACP methyl ester carboxylesterase [Streptomyces sp. MnatMP-M27]
MSSPQDASRGQLRQIDVPGASLTYLDAASRRRESEASAPIVFMHANTGTGQSWRAQLDYFSAHGHRALALDRCGWGGSRLLPGGSRISEADVLTLFHRELGLPPFHLVAASGSAFGAIEYAARPLAPLRSLVLLATMGPLGEPEVREFADQISLGRAGRDLPTAVRELSAGYRGRNPGGARRWSTIAASARNGSQPAPNAQTTNDYTTLAQIDLPTLVIAGGADLISPPAMMREWAAKLPGACLEVVDEAGHALAWERPEKVNELVHRFISDG